MAKNVSSKFSLDDGLFHNQSADNEAIVPTQATARNNRTPAVNATEQAETGEVSLSSLFSPAPVSEHRPLGSTQGKKGQKAKRINMAFGDDVYEYITYESRRRGMNATQFVNMVLSEYRDSPNGKIN